MKVEGTGEKRIRRKKTIQGEEKNKRKKERYVSGSLGMFVCLGCFVALDCFVFGLDILMFVLIVMFWVVNL